MSAAPDVSRIINRTSIVTMGLAAVLSPIPLADEIAFVPVYGIMAARIGKAHGLAARDVPWRAIATTGIAALGARAALNLTVAYIPGVAAVANAISAATITQVLGSYIDAACAAPEGARPLNIREITETIREKMKTRKVAF